MNIFACGDMHGRTTDTRKISKKKWKEQKDLTKEDVLFQLGDFGWVWYEFGLNKEQEYWLDWLTKQRYTVAVVLGNHENYNIIETLPFEEKWGAPVRVLERKQGNIYFLERGYVYTVNGKKIFAFGGARSNDRPDNTQPVLNPYGYTKKKDEVVEGRDWWRQELPTEEEMQRGIKSLEAVGWEVDYVMTHTCSVSTLKKLKVFGEVERHFKWSSKNNERIEDPVSIYLEEIEKKLKFKSWSFGHLHLDYTFEEDGKTYNCFYNDTPMNLNEW